MQTIALFFLVAVAFGGVGLGFLYPICRANGKPSSAWPASHKPEPLARVSARSAEIAPRAVEIPLKDFEERRKKSNKACRSRSASRRPGLSWSKRQFLIISAVIGLAMFCPGFVSGDAAFWSRPCWALRRLRHAALAAVVPEEAPRSEIPRQAFPTPSTSSCAASRPACRCSTA